MGQNGEQIVYPSIIFRLKDDYYSVGSEYVQTIMQKPKFKKIPNSDPMISGVFMFRNSTVPLMSLRSAFGMVTVQDELAEFNKMIDDRKEDHINWVDELRRCIASDEKFTLATDPHKCTFGRWYDSYSTDENVVISHLHQIENPHTRLHNSAKVIEELIAKGDDNGVKEVMSKIDNDYMPKILSLLDGTKEVYEEAFREMVLVLSAESTLGIIVDEVIAVEVLKDVDKDNAVRKLDNTKYIVGVKQSAKFDEIIMELDTRRLLNIADKFKDLA